MKGRVLIILFIFIQQLTNAQDYFFSQFYAAPLILNPALTGLSNGDYRLNINYRNQQKGIVPYTTYSAAFDSKILRSFTGDNTLAAGIVYLNDGYADGVLNNLSMLFSTAYHQVFGTKKNHFLSGGLQIGLLQRRIDQTKLSFSNQWSIANGYDPSIQHGMNFSADQINSADINLGILWYHFLSDKSSVFLGVDAAHLIAPKESFFGIDNRLSKRYLVHLGSRLPLSESMAIVPNLIYNSQNKISQAVIGSLVDYSLNEDVILKSGLWYRNRDKSAIFMAGVELYSMQVSLSYDFYSGVQRTAGSNGGFEISLVYSPYLKPIVKLKSNPGTRF